MPLSDAKQHGDRKSSNVPHVCDDAAVLLYASGQLLPDQNEVFESHLRQCTACGERLAGVTRSLAGGPARRLGPLTGTLAEERRRHQRVSVSDRVTLRSLNPPSLARLDARVVDSSKGGLGLRTRVAVDPGTIVQIRLKRQIALAEVRYCLPSGSGFQVGVEIHDVFPIA